MKALLVSDFFYPHWTGISKSVHYLTQALQSEFAFTVLTVLHEANLLRKETIGQVKVIREPYFLKISRAKYSINLVIRFLKLVSKTDVVIVNAPCSNILPVSLISKIFGKRLVIFYQGDLNLPKGKLNWLIEKMFDFFSVTSFALADQIATYTQDYVENSRLLPLFKDKSQPVLPPLPYFKKDNKLRSKQSNINQALNKLENDSYLVGFAGRFVQEKGFDVLLKAAAQLVQTRNDIKFIFAGETQIDYEDYFAENSNLINQIKDDLTLLGLLNDEELAEFYQALDLFVLPSRSECFGLVQAEAMAQAVPVIVADIPGARDVVSKTNYGLIFEQNNVADLVEKISQALDNLAQFKSYYKQVLNYYDYEQAKIKTAQFIKG